MLEIKIEKTENGKPYLKSNIPLYFSVSHTNALLFIAFSDENIGVDVERIDRNVNYSTLLKKFPYTEREEISSATDFLTHWTAKEAAIKWLGGTLARDLKKLCFIKNQIWYDTLPLPICITSKLLDGHIITVCSERDFSNAELILF